MHFEGMHRFGLAGENDDANSPAFTFFHASFAASWRPKSYEGSLWSVIQESIRVFAGI